MPLSASADPEKIRIAVLPFVNLSQDPDQEYFSDGLTEEMTAQLGRVRPDRQGVIARTSAARFKRSGRSIEEIGRELRVDFVVEGSVRQSGGRVRITAQLVDVSDQTHLWSNTYDGTLADCLAFQGRWPVGLRVRWRSSCCRRRSSASPPAAPRMRRRIRRI